MNPAQSLAKATISSSVARGLPLTLQNHVHQLEVPPHSRGEMFELQWMFLRILSGQPTYHLNFEAKRHETASLMHDACSEVFEYTFGSKLIEGG